MNFLPDIGDDLFARSSSVFSHMIAWATKARWEPTTLATHQGKFGSPWYLVHAEPFHGVYQIEWTALQERYEKRGIEWCILSPPNPPTDSEREKIRESLYAMLGWRYSYLELPLQLLDGLIAKVSRRPHIGIDSVVFRKLGDLWERGVVCSKTANRVDVRLGWLPNEYAHGSPDDAFDWKMANGWKVKEFTEGWFLDGRGRCSQNRRS